MKIILEDHGRKDGKHWYSNYATCWSSEESWLDSRQEKVGISLCKDAKPIVGPTNPTI